MVLEFAGPGIASLGIDYRIGIDVMTRGRVSPSASPWRQESSPNRREISLYRDAL